MSTQPSPPVAPQGPRLADLFQPRPDAIPVIDPDLKLHGRVWVPHTMVANTSGVERYRAAHPYPPSLCILFQSGKCHAGSRCNQIHPDREYMSAVRALLNNTTASNCCQSHGDLASARPDFRTFCAALGTVEILTSADDPSAKISFPASLLGITAFWDKAMVSFTGGTGVTAVATEPLPAVTGDTSNAPRTLSPGQICNLHQKRMCKYGVDCRHVHLCRDFWSHHCAALPSSVSSRVTPNRKSLSPAAPPFLSGRHPTKKHLAPLAALPMDYSRRSSGGPASPLPGMMGMMMPSLSPLPVLEPSVAAMVCSGAHMMMATATPAQFPTAPTGGPRGAGMAGPWSDPAPPRLTVFHDPSMGSPLMPFTTRGPHPPGPTVAKTLHFDFSPAGKRPGGMEEHPEDLPAPFPTLESPIGPVSNPALDSLLFEELGLQSLQGGPYGGPVPSVPSMPYGGTGDPWAPLLDGMLVGPAGAPDSSHFSGFLPVFPGDEGEGGPESGGWQPPSLPPMDPNALLCELRAFSDSPPSVSSPPLPPSYGVQRESSGSYAGGSPGSGSDRGSTESPVSVESPQCPPAP
eukprot:RCo018738